MPNELSSRLHHLEVMLQQLNTDLERVRLLFKASGNGGAGFKRPDTHACSSLSLVSQEKQDKVVLLAEMANLRQNNQRLQEESLTTTEQLRKFSRLFSNLDKVEGDHEAHALTHGADSKRE